jgi:hypothetical protein
MSRGGGDEVRPAFDFKAMCQSLLVMAKLTATLLLAALFLASCAPSRDDLTQLRIAIGPVACSNADVGTVVRDTIAEALLTRQDFITLAQSIADKPDLIILATVTFGAGASSESSGFATNSVGASSAKSTSGEFVNDVSIVVKTPDNRIIAVSALGQSLSGGGRMEAPSTVTWRDMNFVLKKLEQYSLNAHHGGQAP